MVFFLFSKNHHASFIFRICNFFLNNIRSILSPKYSDSTHYKTNIVVCANNMQKRVKNMTQQVFVWLKQNQERKNQNQERKKRIQKTFL